LSKKHCQPFNAAVAVAIDVKNRGDDGRAAESTSLASAYIFALNFTLPTGFSRCDARVYSMLQQNGWQP
jgi:hypothetical protein